MQAPRRNLGGKPVFPLRSGLVDRTEVDMRWGSLLMEAKLTETDFQTRKAAVVEAYRDFDEVFDRELLPRTAIPMGRRKEAIEFPENYSQEYEEPVLDAALFPAVIRPAVVAVEPGYSGYQLIRNVLAAYAQGASFCVLHDQRRPDLREAWFRVMAAVRQGDLRVRLKVLTWQELAAFLPAALEEFLAVKYGIVAPGKFSAAMESAV